jgi:hypothetical protein
MAKTTTFETTLMAPLELEQAIEELCGPGVSGHRAFARGCGLDYSSVHRYLHGKVPVPNYVSILIDMARIMKAHNILPARMFEPYVAPAQYTTGKKAGMPRPNRPRKPDPDANKSELVRWWK